MRTHGNVQKHESANPIQRRLIDRFHEQAVTFVRRAEPACILEVGCGEGYVLAAVQRAGIDAELIGVDFSEPAIEAARRRVAPPAELRVGDAREASRSFSGRRPDLVMMLEVLEHLDDPEAMLDDLAALTTTHVLLSVPREPLFRGMNLLRMKNVRDLGNDPEHVNHWSARAFVGLVNRHFEVIATARPFPWTMVLARVRSAR
jgi:2-polyprenyl-3-methyl-5-hydroxy-6-metoxy-1,4-benzoquinol methylase